MISRNARRLFYLFRLMKNQWLELSELKRKQEKMLRAIVQHAYENVPLYHRKMRRANLRQNDIKTIQDLQKFPITTKSEIRQEFPFNVVSRGVDINTCWKSRTGGSTGIPLTVLYDRRSEDYQKAVAIRANLACGQRITDKWAILTSPNHFRDREWFQQAGLFPVRYVSIFDDIEEQLLDLDSFQPDVLDGYSSSLFLLARELLDREAGDISPRIVFGTAEVLDPPMRKTIELAFQTDVFDQFGCVEVGRTAWECREHSGYHIDCDAVVMEFARDGEQVSAGERGTILYTSLYNYAMPFIRYEIGDVGVPTDDLCPCGRGLPLMKIVEGRKDDFVVLPDGRIISPRVFSVLMKRISGIDQYKIIQESREKVVVQIVRSDNYSQQTIDDIKKETGYVLGEQVILEIDVKENIPREQSGKLRKVVSKVKLNSKR